MFNVKVCCVYRKSKGVSLLLSVPNNSSHPLLWYKYLLVH